MLGNIAYIFGGFVLKAVHLKKTNKKPCKIWTSDLHVSLTVENRKDELDTQSVGRGRMGFVRH